MNLCYFKEILNENGLITIKTECGNLLTVDEIHGHMNKNDLNYCPFCGNLTTYNKTNKR